MLNDVRYALRSLRKHPGFTALAVVTLGLGIGANTATFSVVNGVLLQSLPYDEPDELVSLWTRYLPSSGLDIAQFPLSVPELVDYRDHSAALRDIVPYSTTELTIGGEQGDPARVPVAFVGRGMFDLLGVRAALGRTFSPEEELPGAVPTAVLSHVFWRQRFGGATDIIGRAIEVDGRPVEIVGVMAEGFVFPTAARQLWLPLGLDEAQATNRFAHNTLAVGRLAPGVTFEEARGELETITAGWNAEFEHHAMGHFVFLRDLRTDLIGDAGRALWMLMAAVVLVLLVACVNVANLLIARTESRHLEIAVRTALGASRVRLVRQLLVESGVLAAAGAGLGLALAAWGTAALLAIDPAALPRSENVTLNLPVLAFTAAVALGTALLFGMLPAWHAGTQGVATSAVAETRLTGNRARSRLRRALVGAEAALSLILVLAAGLVTRSFLELTAVDPGVDTENLLTFDLFLPAATYDDPATVPGVYERLLERLRALPGVRAASSATALPIADDPPRIDFDIEGRPEPPPGVPSSNADAIAVQPGFFEAMDAPRLRGRTITVADGPEDPMVAVINRTAAERYWRGENPVGRRFRYASTTPLPWITIVGVVDDWKVDGLDGEPRPQIYLPHRQLSVSQGSTGRIMTVVVRTANDPSTLVAAVRAVVRGIDPALPLANVRTMEDVLGEAVARPRFASTLLGTFGVMALLLAAVGVYGVVSHAVTRRTREIGIRIALGARQLDVLRQVVGEGLRPVLIGAAVGLAVALVGARLLASMLFEVSERDPVTFLTVPLLLGAVALVASYLPARKAARVDPMEALRSE